MDFKFFCPYCGQHIQATEELVGSSAACPVCSQTITIPAQVPLPYVPQIPTRVEALYAPLPKVAKVGYPSSAYRRLKFATLKSQIALICVVALIALLLCAMIYLHKTPHFSISSNHSTNDNTATTSGSASQILLEEACKRADAYMSNYYLRKGDSVYTKNVTYVNEADPLNHYIVEEKHVLRSLDVQPLTDADKLNGIELNLNISYQSTSYRIHPDVHDEDEISSWSPWKDGERLAIIAIRKVNDKWEVHSYDCDHCELPSEQQISLIPERPDNLPDPSDENIDSSLYHLFYGLKYGDYHQAYATFPNDNVGLNSFTVWVKSDPALRSIKTFQIIQCEGDKNKGFLVHIEITSQDRTKYSVLVMMTRNIYVDNNPGLGNEWQEWWVNYIQSATKFTN